jgi:methionyl-tRNA formyltransferase
MTFNILLTGQKYFGAETFRILRALPGVSVAAVVAPLSKGRSDRLADAALRAGLRVIPAGTLNARVMPEGIDLIVAAHSHDFIGEATRHRARFGGIGYHPSLLPLHRGRDAIRWAIRMRDRVTGGSVYRLSNRVDGGNVLAQRHVFIRPDDTERELWERELCPLGIELLAQTVARYAADGYQHGAEQDEELATWEPAIGTAPLHRPDLAMLPAPANLVATP